jgi:aerobic-type carbon monoxide dehydrogenase small subunit (CoxS/CutS family)
VTARLLPPERDRAHPAPGRPITLSVDGEPIRGLEGQSIAGVLLGSGRLTWRITADGRRGRGVFCGIGVCYDCLITVNGLRDVRACQRIAADGDVLTTQDEHLPATAEPGGRTDG